MIPLTVSGLLLANHLVQLNHKAVHSLKVSFLKSMLHFRFELLHSSFEPEPWGNSWSASAACHGTSHQLHHGNVHLTQKRSSSKRRITKEKQFQKEDHSEAKNVAAKHRQGFSQGSDCRGGSSTVSHKVPARVLHHEAVLILHEAIAEAMEPPRQKYGEDGGLRRGVQTPAALQAIWVQVKL